MPFSHPYHTVCAVRCVRQHIYTALLRLLLFLCALDDDALPKHPYGLAVSHFVPIVLTTREEKRCIEKVLSCLEYASFYLMWTGRN